MLLYCLTPGERVEPATNATSDFCARAKVETARNIKDRTAACFFNMGLLLNRDSSERDDVNFNRDILRQARHFYRGTRRRSVLANFFVDPIHLGEFRHIF